MKKDRKWQVYFTTTLHEGKKLAERNGVLSYHEVKQWVSFIKKIIQF